MGHVPTILFAGQPLLPGFIAGQQASVLALNSMVAELARTDIPVLILGESGTGKDVYARLIHYLSPQRNVHLQKINCAATNASELTWRPNGSLPAVPNQDQIPGIYLDNIQELDLAGQRALLSQLSDGGSMGCRHASGARLISSTTRNLEPDVASGKFRHEVYFRLNGACLRLPPLRERAEDIPELVECFLAKYSEITKRVPPSLNSKTLQILMEYHWPGNIRELESFIRKILVFGDVQAELDELQKYRPSSTPPLHSIKNASLKVAARAASKEAERELILRALERTHWNRKRAAQDLKISYKALLYKIKQIGLSSSSIEV
jgi:two-component system response regulator AtoC